MHAKLTKAQLDFYDFIMGFTEKNRRWPTYHEIMEHFEYKSTASVSRKYKHLCKKGYMTKDEGEGYFFTDKRPGLGANVKSETKEG